MHELRDIIKNRIDRKSNHLSLLIQSFGFKFGVPIDSDMVFDVRCLPNPYWDHELRPFTGKDEKIIAFLDASLETSKLFEDICKFVEKWIPKFEANNRSYMTISIGCTGGQHRSVYIADKLVAHLKPLWENVQIRHREL